MKNENTGESVRLALKDYVGKEIEATAVVESWKEDLNINRYGKPLLLLSHLDVADALYSHVHIKIDTQYDIRPGERIKFVGTVCCYDRKSDGRRDYSFLGNTINRLMVLRGGRWIEGQPIAEEEYIDEAPLYVPPVAVAVPEPPKPTVNAIELLTAAKTVRKHWGGVDTLKAIRDGLMPHVERFGWDDLISVIEVLEN